jgi:hypothetical protein
MKPNLSANSPNVIVGFEYGASGLPMLSKNYLQFISKETKNLKVFGAIVEFKCLFVWIN